MSKFEIARLGIHKAPDGVSEPVKAGITSRRRDMQSIQNRIQHVPPEHIIICSGVQVGFSVRTTFGFMFETNR